MSWETFRDRFEEEILPHRRDATQDNYREPLNLFEKLCRPTTIRGVNNRAVSAFAAAMRKSGGHKGGGMEASTIKVRLQFLHTVLVWATKQELIPKCPDFPTMKLPKKKPQSVAAESFERLIDKADDPQMRAYQLCGWLAGLRWNEARALEWEESTEVPWVDFGRNRIWLPAGGVKGDEDQWVPLDPQLRKALELLPRHGRKVFRFVAKDGHEVGDVAVSHRVVALAKPAGVRLTMKGLRKGFVCRYAGKVPAQVLQKLMRNSNSRVTMDYYANVDDAVEAAVLGEQRVTGRVSDQKPAAESDVSEVESPLSDSVLE